MAVRSIISYPTFGVIYTGGKASNIIFKYAVDNSDDNNGIPNGSYFMNLDDKLPYYKDVAGFVSQATASVAVRDATLFNTTGVESLNVNDQILALELELQFAQKTYYKTFTYDINDNIENKSIYKTDEMIDKLFNVDYFYDGSDLWYTYVTRISDGASITKVFNYTLGNLTSITTT